MPEYPSSGGSVPSVTYVPAAGPGALVVNVKSAPYNAAGNGTTNDTVAIQAALDFATSANAVGIGAIVFFPAGKYKVTSTLTIGTGITPGLGGLTLLGVGAGIGYGYATLGGTQIISTITTRNPLLRNDTNLVGLSIRGIAFVGPGQAAVTKFNNTDLVNSMGSSGLMLPYCYDAVIEGCTVTGFATGVHLLQVDKFAIRSCDIYGNRNVGLAVVSSIAVNVTASTIRNQNDTGAATSAASDTVTNILVDGFNATYPSQGVILDLGIYDELGLGSTAGGSIVTVDKAQDTMIRGGQCYPGGPSSAGAYYGIWIKAGAVRTNVSQLAILPYTVDANHVPTNTIKIDAGATDTILGDIKTTPNGGGDITDAGTRTIYRNVNAVTSDSRYARAVLADGPIAYWRLGDAAGTVAADEMKASPGRYVLAPTLGVTGATTGDSNKAATFNGSSQYIEVPDSNWLDVGDVFTLECWVKRPGAGGGPNFALLSKGTNSFLLQMNGSDHLYLEKQDVASIVASTTTITDTAWHHVAATKSGATVKLYIDGVDVTGTVTNATLSDTSTALNIGRRVVANSEWFLGSLDEVAIYATALSAASVAAHYAAR